MQIKNQETYWEDIRSEIEVSFKSSAPSFSCDVLIVGGGISGALIAYEFMNSDLSICLVDKVKIASRSTSASTALITYELDTPLVELKRQKGDDAAEVYRLTHDAINKLRKIADTYDEQVEKLDTQSVYLADSRKDFETLNQEYSLRKQQGYDVQIKNSDELEKEYGLQAAGALVSNGNYVLNPVNLTRLILSDFKKKHEVYEFTEINEFTASKDGVILRTTDGSTIKAKKVIWAKGYENQLMVDEPKIRLLSTYVCVTKPLKNNPLKGLQIWQYKDPYIYTRTTPDNRVIIGGEDTKILNSFIREKLLGFKIKKLLTKLQAIREDIELQKEYSWVATFGESEDSMPYFGEIEKYPNCFFVIPCGGNGITFSTLAGQIVKDWVKGNDNRYAQMFRFGR